MFNTEPVSLSVVDELIQELSKDSKTIITPTIVLNRHPDFASDEAVRILEKYIEERPGIIERVHIAPCVKCAGTKDITDLIEIRTNSDYVLAECIWCDAKRRFYLEDVKYHYRIVRVM